MREILFRGKRVDNGEWVYGYLMDKHFINVPYDDPSVGGCFDNPYEVDPETVGQFTGLIDYYDNKIFEGDIMFLNSELQKTYGLVEFGEHPEQRKEGRRITQQVGFFVRWSNRLLRTDIGYWASRKHCQVAGNIYDNPKLLEEK